ncbi:hypothetical protein CGZ91_01595 [Parenemella sanctibonifatiensis]|uniref:M23ase beta-sheet core domain-containing protein n=1 Tax=Parenemella sanctibonifatiensis TaxID=2016505 RepID=A0A255EMM3_9ACTN|nr:hypothetical protein CGZ91_01595 [Parenemella sanctibonifatiensis]
MLRLLAAESEPFPHTRVTQHSRSRTEERVSVNAGLVGRLVGKRRARRALETEPAAATDDKAEALDAADEDLSWGAMLRHGLATCAISGLGLVLMGTVAMTSSAQATDTHPVAGLQSDQPNITAAEPRPLSISERSEAALSMTEERKATSSDEGEDGGLSSFNQGDGQSTTPLQSRLDKAVGAQVEQQRSSSLNETSRNADKTSGGAVADRREEQKAERDQQIAQEQERLVEEKRKQEEEQKRQREAALAGNGLTLPPNFEFPPMGEISGKGALPVPSPARVTARWGQTGPYWGRYHTGLDFGAPNGTPIYAAVDGVVLASTAGGWAGNHVIIRASDGSGTLYAHMSAKVAQPGQTVTAGQLIGYVGSTGNVSGPHLHFEYYPPGTRPGSVYESRDPAAFLRSLGVQVG